MSPEKYQYYLDVKKNWIEYSFLNWQRKNLKPKKLYYNFQHIETTLNLKNTTS